VQAEVSAKGCKTFQEFEETVVQTIKMVPLQMVLNLYKSMDARVHECIRLGGNKTHY
jgi:hypothetical protein